MIRTNYYAHYNDENLNLTSNWCDWDFAYIYFVGTNYILMKTCPVGTGVLDKLECTKACTQLGLPFVEKKFKTGRTCYKNGKGICNQNGAAGSKATMLCKVVGK